MLFLKNIKIFWNSQQFDVGNINKIVEKEEISLIIVIIF